MFDFVKAHGWALLKRLPNVQVSDTTGDAMKNSCWLQKIIQEPLPTYRLRHH